MWCVLIGRFHRLSLNPIKGKEPQFFLQLFVSRYIHLNITGEYASYHYTYTAQKKHISNI